MKKNVGCASGKGETANAKHVRAGPSLANWLHRTCFQFTLLLQFRVTVCHVTKS